MPHFLKDFQLRDGLAETFHDNRKLSSRTNYVNGKMDGELLTYYSGCTLENRSRRIKGKINGRTTFYYPDGAVKNTLDYVNSYAKGAAAISIQAANWPPSASTALAP